MNRYVSYVLIGAATACLLLLFIGLPPTEDLRGQTIAGTISVPIANTSSGVLVLDQNINKDPECYKITSMGTVAACVDFPDKVNGKKVKPMHRYEGSCVVCYAGTCYTC